MITVKILRKIVDTLYTLILFKTTEKIFCLNHASTVFLLLVNFKKSSFEII